MENLGANESGDNGTCQGAKTWPTADQVSFEKGAISHNEILWQYKISTKKARGAKNGASTPPAAQNGRRHASSPAQEKHQALRWDKNLSQGKKDKKLTLGKKDAIFNSWKSVFSVLKI